MPNSVTIHELRFSKSHSITDPAEYTIEVSLYATINWFPLVFRGSGLTRDEAVLNLLREVMTEMDKRFLDIAQLSRADWHHYQADKIDLITGVEHVHTN